MIVRAAISQSICLIPFKKGPEKIEYQIMLMTHMDIYGHMYPIILQV